VLAGSSRGRDGRRLVAGANAAAGKRPAVTVLNAFLRLSLAPKIDVRKCCHLLFSKLSQLSLIWLFERIVYHV
jgi:hypothetical protein